MQIHSLLNVTNGDPLGATREFLKTLLHKSVVDALLVPLQLPDADHITPSLVQDPSQLDQADPFAPVMQINGAAVIAKIQHAENPARMGAVLRPCEMRATSELAKLGRVDPSRLILIGVDCLGTFEPAAYGQLVHASANSPTAEMLRWTRQGAIAPYRLRHACQMCEQFLPENADLAIQLIGMNAREQVGIEAREALAARLGLVPAAVNPRHQAIARLVAIRHRRREQALTEMSHLLGDVPSILRLVAPCSVCGKCIVACPYCETYGSKRAPSNASQSDRTARRLRAIAAWGRRAALCVSCGMCESACPQQIPLTAIQAALNQRMQKKFGYAPGRCLDQKLPWAA